MKPSAGIVGVKPGEFIKAVPIQKVDETKQEAWGIFTAEVPDSDKEIADYAYQKNQVQLWSDSAKSITTGSGQETSLGNLRFQHTMLVTGKVIALNMNDSAKEISGGTYVANVGDTKTWDLVAKGILQGFSFGGRYHWRKCEECQTDLPLEQGNNLCPNCDKEVLVRYGAGISELSIVDRPAVPIANILHIKADGSSVLQKASEAVAEEKKTKRVGGKDCTSDCFAWVGDESDTKTWKLPIKSPDGDDAWEKRHIRNALARFGQTKGIPDDKKAEVKAKIVAAAKKHGIEVDEEESKSTGTTLVKSFIAADSQAIKEKIESNAKAAGITFRKGMYDVGEFASVLQQIAWLRYAAMSERDWEDDDSEVPEMLEANLVSLTESFLAMAEEEAGELIAAAKKAGGARTMKKAIELSEDAQDALTGHITDLAAHHETAAEAHKAAADHHTAKAAEHKAAHEHFQKAADDGGEHAEHHAMHAKMHKSTMESHEYRAAHHTAMHKAHSDMAECYGKMAEAMAETPEKAAKALKDSRAKKPAIVKSATAAPAVISTEGMSDVEKAAYESVRAEYFGSPEYKAKVRASLDAQTTAKMNADANANAAVIPGVADPTGDLYSVQRGGSANKASAGGTGDNRGDAVEAADIFSFVH